MRTLVLFAIGLIFGGGLGFVAAAGMGVAFDGHDHGDAAQHGAGKGHDAALEVDAVSAPSLTIMLKKDLMSGYNLHVLVENFEFAPQQAGLAHRAAQGHAHVYVNGVKQGRLYGPWMHLDALPSGDVAIDVTLNSNNHRPLAVNGAPISASQSLIIE